MSNFVKKSLDENLNEISDLFGYFGIGNAPKSSNKPELQINEQSSSESFQLPIQVGGKDGLPLNEGGKPWIVSRHLPGEEHATPTHPQGHNGIDLKAPRGTLIYPIASGVVSKVGTDPKGGNVVFTMHNKGKIRVYYAHMDSILVRPGQTITRATPIGTVGDSGNAKGRGAHLHYEVRVDGNLVDPLSLTGKKLETYASIDYIDARKNILLDIWRHARLDILGKEVSGHEHNIKR